MSVSKYTALMVKESFQRDDHRRRTAEERRRELAQREATQLDEATRAIPSMNGETLP